MTRLKKKKKNEKKRKIILKKSLHCHIFFPTPAYVTTNISKMVQGNISLRLFTFPTKALLKKISRNIEHNTTIEIAKCSTNISTTI